MGKKAKQYLTAEFINTNTEGIMPLENHLPTMMDSGNNYQKML